MKTERNHVGIFFGQGSRIIRCYFAIIVVVLLGFAKPAIASTQAHSVKLLVKVVDETGVAVPDARVLLEHSSTQTIVRGETDAAGRHEFTLTNVGSYQIKIEKEGFYLSTTNLPINETQDVEVTIYHLQEIAETVNVFDSPPAIDPGRTASTEVLTSREILTVPYPSTRDYRKALPLL